jgi:hypothetical protein
LLVASALCATICSPAAASGPPNAPMPLAMPAPRSFTAHAHADLKIVFGGSPIDLAARVTIAQRDLLARYDIAIDRGGSPIGPSGGVTLLLDRSTNTLTLRNDATKLYYVQSLTPSLATSATPAPTATTSPHVLPAPRSPLADLDQFVLNVQLTGHSTVIGLPATGIIATIDYRRTGSAAPAHARATVDLADDFAWFPLDAEATIDPGITGITATLHYAVDDFDRTVPPLSAFVVPAGYVKAATIFGVLSKGASALPGF